MRSDGLNNKGATQYRKVNQGLQEEKDRKSLNKYKKGKKKVSFGNNHNKVKILKIRMKAAS